MNQLTKSQIIQIEAAIGKCKKEIAEISGKNVLISYYMEDNVPHNITPIEIAALCAEAFNTEVDLLFGKSRMRNIAGARHMLRYILRTVLKHSHKKIGQFTNSDHSTTIHSCRQCANWIETDEDFMAKYVSVCEKINNK
jgi:chromosomal replication initiation ATPase DnaA